MEHIEVKFSDCRYIIRCSSFFESISHMPSTVDRFKRKFCKENSTICARYMAFHDKGCAKLPKDFFPNQTEGESQHIEKQPVHPKNTTPISRPVSHHVSDKINISKKNILILEDNDTIRSSLSIYLREEGMNVFETKTVDEALAKAKEVLFDIVLLDICLIDELGMDFSIAVAKDPDLYGNPKIIVISGTVGGDLVHSENFKQECNFHFFLKKPFILQDVKKTIEQLLT